MTPWWPRPRPRGGGRSRPALRRRRRVVHRGREASRRRLREHHMPRRRSWASWPGCSMAAGCGSRRLCTRAGRSRSRRLRRRRARGRRGRMVTDTCTYITPILDPAARVVMTDSAKWAWYAPANLGGRWFSDRGGTASIRRYRGRSPAIPRCGAVRARSAGKSSPYPSPGRPDGLCRPVPQERRRPALPLRQPLSLWGGVDPADGRIIDPPIPNTVSR